MRGATYLRRYLFFGGKISTHTPHARCDHIGNLRGGMEIDFYSHTSCEVRLRIPYVCPVRTSFLLTHLMRGATTYSICMSCAKFISTHTPHARCDPNYTNLVSAIWYFYSHTSCEVRLVNPHKDYLYYNFYSHTSCEVRLFSS